MQVVHLHFSLISRDKILANRLKKFCLTNGVSCSMAKINLMIDPPQKEVI